MNESSAEAAEIPRNKPLLSWAVRFLFQTEALITDLPQMINLSGYRPECMENLDSGYMCAKKIVDCSMNPSICNNNDSNYVPQSNHINYLLAYALNRNNQEVGLVVSG